MGDMKTGLFSLNRRCNVGNRWRNGKQAGIGVLTGPRRRATETSVTSVAGVMAMLVLGTANCTSAQSDLDAVESEEVTFRVVEVVSDLDRPWAFEFLPDGRMLITERPGRMRVFENGELREVSGLPEVRAQGQGGLLDVVKHPDFENNSLIYFSYSAAYEGGVGTNVSRAVLDGDELRDVERIFRMDPPGSGGRHFGSRLAFDEQNRLFITIGDRGHGARDASHPSQRLDRHHGKLLRVNDDGSVPADNPFVDRDDAHPEIYSYGHRNAQGLVYDLETGRIWQHEHGPFGGDTLNLIQAGANYGWPVATYGAEYRGRSEIGTVPEQRQDIVEPVTHWTLPHSIAPSGLALYRGDVFPEWEENLFVGALRQQHIRRVVLGEDGETVVHEEELLRNAVGRIRDVRTGPDGHLWFATDASPGAVYRIDRVE